MKPRIFVSSTFYDLKYIREDLSNFIRVHDFDPILFEDGDIGYIPGRKLDQSCYEQMKTADMVLLIIGGNYGSAASDQTVDDFQEYMSITRKEFQTAVRENIPIFVFIDSAVYTEFGIYEANYNEIEVKKIEINFRSTKNINVFRFIKEIKSMGHLSITEFKKIAEIKEFLSKQWSDMFKNYLTSLRNGDDSKLVGTVDELKILIKKMDIMLDNVGKKVLNEDGKTQYNDVLLRQKTVELTSLICNSFGLLKRERSEDIDERISVLNEFVDTLIELEEEFLKDDTPKESRDYADKIFTLLTSKNIPIYSVAVNFFRDTKKWSTFLKDENNKQALVKALAEDENYNYLFNDEEES